MTCDEDGGTKYPLEDSRVVATEYEDERINQSNDIDEGLRMIGLGRWVRLAGQNCE